MKLLSKLVNKKEMFYEIQVITRYHSWLYQENVPV